MLGYALLLRLNDIRIPIIQSVASACTALSATIRDADIAVTACPDTLLTLTAFAGDFAPPASAQASAPVPKAMADMSGSLLLPRRDAPEADVDKWQQVPQTMKGEVIATEAGETVTIYGDGTIEQDIDWFSRSHNRIATTRSPLPAASVRIHNTNITISLFEGYDFESTRRFIKNRVKATRIRLEKIKQLLAEGQMPEETVDEAADWLKQSVFLPARTEFSPNKGKSRADEVDADLDEDGQAEMTLADRIAHLDDALDAEEAEGRSSEEWEALPHRPPTMRRTHSSGSPKPAARGKPSKLRVLHRPRDSAVDIRLQDVAVRFDLYSADSDSSSSLSSKLSVDIRDLTIVDNIRTSTWNKFLTELRYRDGGTLRPTGEAMVRIKLKMMKNAEGGGDEADLRVRGKMSSGESMTRLICR